VAGSLEEARSRLAISRAAGETAQGALRDVVDGYEWLTIAVEQTVPDVEDVILHTLDDPFAAFAARRLILGEMQRQRAQIDDLATLDALHAVAVEQGIVTPYSSMIVLVNERQEKRLEQLEGWDDRFDRESEEVGGTTPSPFQVTGVPEPHEWLLIGVGIIMLVWYSRRRIFWHQRIRR
jgi:putative PEP-CTERM system integral membrane protein